LTVFVEGVKKREKKTKNLLRVIIEVNAHIVQDEIGNSTFLVLLYRKCSIITKPYSKLVVKIQGYQELYQEYPIQFNFYLNQRVDFKPGIKQLQSYIEQERNSYDRHLAEFHLAYWFLLTNEIADFLRILKRLMQQTDPRIKLLSQVGNSLYYAGFNNVSSDPLKSTEAEVQVSKIYHDLDLTDEWERNYFQMVYYYILAFNSKKIQIRENYMKIVTISNQELIEISRLRKSKEKSSIESPK